MQGPFCFSYKVACKLISLRWSVYWTFAEFCQHLQNDLAWFTFTCLRTDELKEVKPRVSNMIMLV